MSRSRRSKWCGTRSAVTSPQPGIFALGTSSHAWLEFDLLDGADDPAGLVGQVANPGSRDDDRRRQPRRRLPVGAVGGGRASRGAAWYTGFDAPVVSAERHDAGSDTARRRHLADRVRLRRRVRPVTRRRDGPRRRGDAGERDRRLAVPPRPRFTGFIDGTENPTLVEATDVALLPPGAPGAGGSILLLQAGARRRRLGAAARTGPGVDHRPAQGGQRGAGPGAAGRTSPGPIRGPSARSSGGTSRSARSSATARSSSGSAGPADPGIDAREHGRSRRRAARCADDRRQGGDRRLLRRSVGRRPGRTVRQRAG